MRNGLRRSRRARAGPPKATSFLLLILCAVSLIISGGAEPTLEPPHGNTKDDETKGGEGRSGGAGTVAVEEDPAADSPSSAGGRTYVDDWPTRPPTIIEAEARTARELSLSVRKLNRDLAECTGRAEAIESGFQKLYRTHLVAADGLRKCKEGVLSADDLRDLVETVESVPGVPPALMEQAHRKDDLRQRAERNEAAAAKHKEVINSLHDRVQKLTTRERSWERTISELMARKDLLEHREITWERTITELMADIELRQERQLWWEQMKRDMERRIAFLSHIAVVEQYGPGPHHVRMNVLLEPNDPSAQRSVVLELAPLDLLPHAVHVFLSQITAGYWTRGTPAFAVRAGHVLQACPHPCLETAALGGSRVGDPYGEMRGRGLATVSYQEYSPEYPHARYTVGFAGRPLSGPEFYVNLVDNSLDHGPRRARDAEDEESEDEEPYPCFGRVVEGFDVVDEIAAGLTRASLPDAGENGELDLHLLLRPVAIVGMEIVKDYASEAKKEEEGEESRPSSSDEL